MWEPAITPPRKTSVGEYYSYYLYNTLYPITPEGQLRLKEYNTLEYPEKVSMSLTECAKCGYVE